MAMYLISFGIEGYESMLCIDEYKDTEDDLLARLKDNDSIRTSDKLGPILNSMSIRFRMNSHRNIESYTVGLEPSIVRQIEEGLCENDESIKDLVREKGEKIRI